MCHSMIRAECLLVTFSRTIVSQRQKPWRHFLIPLICISIFARIKEKLKYL